MAGVDGGAEDARRVDVDDARCRHAESLLGKTQPVGEMTTK